MNRTVYSNVRSSLSLATIVILTSACVQTGENVKNPGSSISTSAFSVGVGSKDNEFVVLNQRGEEIKLIEVDFPIKGEEIQSMNTFTAMRVKGSCFYLLQFAGKTFKITLPPSACQE